MLGTGPERKANMAVLTVLLAFDDAPYAIGTELGTDGSLLAGWAASHQSSALPG